MSLALATVTGGRDWLGSSLELSLSTGVVALLDKLDNEDESSEWYDKTDMDDPKEEFCASSAIRASVRAAGALGIGVAVGGLLPQMSEAAV
jgi:hypothetical protein